MNLLNETLRCLAANGKSFNDVNFCMIDIQEHHDYYDVYYNAEYNGPVYFSWEDFKRLADRKYDSGYGGTEVHDHLKIVGSDFWLERHEYDGSEWWEFKQLPKIPAKSVSFEEANNLVWIGRGFIR